MKRSEANQIEINIATFCNQYEIIGCPDENQDPYFSHGGCACCSPDKSLGNNVYDIKCISDLEAHRQDSDSYNDEKICVDCLSAIHNADLSYLDYYVDDEDCEKITDEEIEKEVTK